MTTIVIGAGPAGLAAARKLNQSDEDVVVLEAQPHIGGRTRTDRSRFHFDQPADLGASYIDIGQDKLISTCHELGVAITPTRTLFPKDPDGRLTAASPMRVTVVSQGRRLPDDERDAVADEVRAALDAVPPRPTEIVPAWAARAGLSPEARRLFCAQPGYNPVSESSMIQMAALEPPHVGRVCWMMADGTDSLAHALAEGLDIRLEQPVLRVRRADHSFLVETRADSYHADDVIVATPVTPMLSIGFDPVLPAWKTEALLATPMTQGGKVVAQYRNGARIIEQVGYAVAGDGPIALMWTRPLGPDDTVVVMGLIPDRADGVLRDEERALRHLDDLVREATGVDPVRIAGITKDWTMEPYAGGVVSSLMGDFPRLPSVLAQAVGRLHFAGEHTAEMWATGMDGALRSGERAADEVLQHLRLRQLHLTTSNP